MPRDLLPALIVLVVIVPWVALLARRSFRLKQVHDDRQRLQERIKVLETIVTDPGTRTAAQIEALRDPHPANH